MTTLTLQDEEQEDNKWDCESILSTYSNIYNHPKLITQIPSHRIRLSNKTGLPLAPKQKIPVKEVDDDDDEDRDTDDSEDGNLLSINLERKKGETSEERRARKHAVKAMRKVNRARPGLLSLTRSSLL